MASLVDTCILVDLLRGSDRARLAVRGVNGPVFFSGVSSLELHVGIRSQQDEARVDRLLAMFRLAETNAAIWRVAGQHLRHFKPSHGVDIPDAIIAATAEVHGLELLTLNVKHFPMFKRLRAAY
jgi:predicted nucleic acid-binding protein